MYIQCNYYCSDRLQLKFAIKHYKKTLFPVKQPALLNKKRHWQTYAKELWWFCAYGYKVTGYSRGGSKGARGTTPGALKMREWKMQEWKRQEWKRQE